jgi:hypothetical protein
MQQLAKKITVIKFFITTIITTTIDGPLADTITIIIPTSAQNSS